MTPLEIKLASVVAHLAEYVSGQGDAMDLEAATGIISDPEVSEAVESMARNALLPVSRSGESVFEMLGM